jgi:hypothetical protein
VIEQRLTIDMHVANRNKLLASKSKIEWLGIGTQSRPRGSGTNEKLRGTSAANMPIELGRRDDTNAPSRSPISHFIRQAEQM